MAGAMSTGDFIRSVFPSTVNREGVIFKALLADDNATGTIERIFNKLEDTRKKYYHRSPYSMIDKDIGQLSVTFNFLSVLPRMAYDTDEIYSKRNEVLFGHGGRTLWGTTHDVQSTIGQVLGNGTIMANTYIVTGTGRTEDNLLVDPDFEVLAGAVEGKTQWTITRCAFDTEDTRFEGTASVILGDGGSIKQSVMLEKGAYFLHLFIKGDVNVTIADSAGHWFSVEDGDGADAYADTNNAHKGLGHWTEIQTQIALHSDSWNDKRIAFIVQDVPDITITITGADKGAEVDWTRLYKAALWPSFTFISVSDLYISKTLGATATAEPGMADHYTNIDENNYWETQAHKDDVEMAHRGNGAAMGYTDMENGSRLALNYDNMSYIGHTALLGPSPDITGGMLQKILEILFPAGVEKHLEQLAKINNTETI